MDIPLILNKVFSFLSLTERLRVRMVCKEWYNFVNFIEQRDVLCVFEAISPYKLKWPSDSRYVREAVKINSSRLDFKDAFLKNLKSLFIYSVDMTSFSIFLGSLVNLEELSLEHFSWQKLKNPDEWNLPNPKTLNLRNIDLELVLCAPKLESLNTTMALSKYLRFVHPNSIRSIKCGDLWDSKNFEFSNLRRLVAFKIHRYFKLDLEKIPNLKVVELYECDTSLLYDAIKFAKDLKKQKSLLGCDDLQILINGFRDLEIVLKSRYGFMDVTDEGNYRKEWLFGHLQIVSYRSVKSENSQMV